MGAPVFTAAGTVSYPWCVTTITGEVEVEATVQTASLEQAAEWTGSGPVMLQLSFAPSGGAGGPSVSLQVGWSKSWQGLNQAVPTSAQVWYGDLVLADLGFTW